ncbi:hypothetical protein QR680_014269 [Steinernema hermaphroditum]|uniref:C-type lectin domain-containing protein n=1 Tax=Steinernema hermaphroditum TaxID=289476 RepID=A0AA39I8B8_9BILA|nr:hypothetical protein QR680_014269 [Steinernema hermaphroditum]
MGAPSLLILFLLIPVGLAGDIIRIFQGTNVTVLYRIDTSRCDSAGTNFCTPSTATIDGRTPYDLHQGMLDYFRYMVPKKVFDEVEQACYDNAVGSDRNQTVYEDCFHPNLVNFHVVENGPEPDEWKPESFILTLWYKRNESNVAYHLTNFAPHPDCELDWVRPSGDSFLCRDGPPKSGKYLRGGIMPDRDICDNSKRRIRVAGDLS